MIKSPTRSLAQLLASTGHDDDDIFVARAINPVRSTGGADHGSSDQGQGRPGIIRSEGGFDYHKLNTTLALLRSHTGVTPDDDTDRTDAGDEPGTGEGSEDTGQSGGTGAASPGDKTGTQTGGTGTPTGSTDTGNTDSGDNDTGDNDTDDGQGPAVDTTVTGTAGDDILSGGDGNDTFVFGPHGGNDIITNFDVGNDVLDLRAYGFASHEDALSHAVADSAGMALVIGTDRIVLNDVTFAQAADLSILFV